MGLLLFHNILRLEQVTKRMEDGSLTAKYREAVRAVRLGVIKIVSLSILTDISSATLLPGCLSHFITIGKV